MFLKISDFGIKCWCLHQFSDFICFLFIQWKHILQENVCCSDSQDWSDMPFIIFWSEQRNCNVRNGVNSAQSISIPVTSNMFIKVTHHQCQHLIWSANSDGIRGPRTHFFDCSAQILRLKSLVAQEDFLIKNYGFSFATVSPQSATYGSFHPFVIGDNRISVITLFASYRSTEHRFLLSIKQISCR